MGSGARWEVGDVMYVLYNPSVKRFIDLEGRPVSRRGAAKIFTSRENAIQWRSDLGISKFYTPYEWGLV